MSNYFPTHQDNYSISVVAALTFGAGFVGLYMTVTRYINLSFDVYTHPFIDSFFEYLLSFIGLVMGKIAGKDIQKRTNWSKKYLITASVMALSLIVLAFVVF